MNKPTFFITSDADTIRKMYQALRDLLGADNPPSIDDVEAFRAYWASRGLKLEYE